VWSYLVRRLLLIIPTLFGVTVVSFLVMKLAPGDPLLSQMGSSGVSNQTGQTRDAYLIQKRDLKLDKPILLNFNYFRDYTEPVRMAAHYLALDDNRLAAELGELAAQPTPPAHAARLEFLRGLGIADFDRRLADPAQRGRLAQAVKALVQPFCEDYGVYAVPAAVALLRSPQTSRAEKIGLAKVLTYMVPEPFTFTYSRVPSEAQTSEVQCAWKTWWRQYGKKYPPVEADERKALADKLAALANEPSRQKLQEEIEYIDPAQLAFFYDALRSAPSLAEKAVAAFVLRMHGRGEIRLDVPPGADDATIDRVAENWLAHYDGHRADYELNTWQRLGAIVTDTQYAHMVWRLVTFNFGRSALKTREPVSEKIWSALIVTAPLILLSELIIYLVAIPLGILCAVNRGRWADRLISLGLYLLYSVPAFVAGMMMLLFLCYGEYLKLFPMMGLHSEGAARMGWLAWLADYAWHAALPIVCLSLFSLAGLAMYARSSLLDVLGQDYIRTARSKGVPESKVVLKHALRNAMIPFITLFASFLPAMLGGSVLVEYLFNIPGMGRLSFESVLQRDYPTLMAMIYIDAIVVMLSMLMSDLLYVLVDPRITFSGQGASA